MDFNIEEFKKVSLKEITERYNDIEKDIAEIEASPSKALFRRIISFDRGLLEDAMGDVLTGLYGELEFIDGVLYLFRVLKVKKLSIVYQNPQNDEEGFPMPITHDSDTMPFLVNKRFDDSEEEEADEVTEQLIFDLLDEWDNYARQNLRPLDREDEFPKYY